MSKEKIEEFSELFPIVLKRVLPLGIIALIITFFLIIVLVPEPEKVSALIVTIFGVSIAFGIFAKRYGEKLLKEKNLKKR